MRIRQFTEDLKKQCGREGFRCFLRNPVLLQTGHITGMEPKGLQSPFVFILQTEELYIIGMLRDKEQDEILKETCGLASQILTVSTKGERGLAAYDLACMASNYHNNVTAVDSVQEAVELSYLLSDKDTVVIAFGSLSYLGELIKMVESLSVKKNRNDIGRDSHGKQRED